MSGLGSGLSGSMVGERLLDGALWTRRRKLPVRDGLTADLLRGDAEVLRCSTLLDAFVEECPGAAAWGGTTGWVRDAGALGDIPIVAFVRRGECLLAVAFGVEHTARGRASWLGSCGNLTGQRGIFVLSGESEHSHTEILLAAADAMMHTGLVAVLMSRKQSGGAARVGQPAAMGLRSTVAAFARREVYDTFDLGRSMDESLAKLGAHTRRNLRYYRRRAMRESGCEFLPAMESQMMRSAVVELQFATDDRIRPGVAKNRIAQVMRKPEAFCMGLRAADGRWLSWLTGWRVGAETFVDWQCNRGGMPRYSLSTVMRSYLIQHESEMGQTQIRFLGGTPHTMHYGFREEVCEDWLIVRKGPWAGLLRALRPVLVMVRRWKQRADRAGVAQGGTRSAVRSGRAMHLLKRMAGVLMAG